MPNRWMPRTALALLGLILALGPILPATAQSLDELRAQGIIAERYDGLVEVRVEDPPARAKQVVERVNAERRKIYRKRAESEGVPVDEVGKIYAQQVLKKAPEGTYFRKPDGTYARK